MATLDCSVKVSAPPVAVKFTTVELDTPPLVPVTTTDAFCTFAMLAEAVMERSVEVVELVGVKLQVAPDGTEAEQAKVTVPANPFCGVTVIVLLLLVVPTAAVKDVVLGESVKLAWVGVGHAPARLLASTEPSPVTRL